MKEYTDQMNNIIRLASEPCRIVSLVPSQTELLYDLGLEDQVVGITKFCIHPEQWYRNKNRIGGTKSVDIDKVRTINPDIIIGNKEENSQSDIEALKEIAPVWMSDIFNLEDSLEMIKSLGEITGKVSESILMINEIEKEFESIKSLISSKEKTVLYFIWNEPKLIAGKNTFINDMLERCGLLNLSSKPRYPEVEEELNPYYVFLSSEPFPFKIEHIQSFKKLYPESIVKIVDGEMFSWYGSRLLKAPSYFKTLELF